jgi:hypothetical protein
MHDHTYVVVSDAEKVMRLDDLEPLVHQGCRVDRDLRPHRPARMRERLGDRHIGEAPGGASAERAARGRQPQPGDVTGRLPNQALEDRRVLAVDRDDAVGSQPGDERAAGHEGLLVRECEAGA